MDELRCNNLRCRKSLTLEGSAVVTTCSHIFCIDCANALFAVPQICPACETALSDQDDVVQTTFNPHDSYKTSVLAGLQPTIILDIASRALNFYTYQVQQEAIFQAMLNKTAQERVAVLEAQVNTVTREANAEVAILKDRVTTAEKELELERRRVRELQEAHKANTKAYAKLKAQYDKSKQRALLNPGDHNLSQAFQPHPAPSPAAARQSFIPAPGHDAFSRSASSASHPGGNAHPRAGGNGWNASASQPQLFGQGQNAAGSASRPRRPLQPQQNFLGGGGGGGGGGNSARKMNLVNATGHQPGEGMPQFLGQSAGRTMGGGSGGRGLFRPANLTGSSRHSG